MISKEEVKHIADLAKLEFDEEGLEKISKELSNILGYMKVLDDVDVSEIEENEIISTNINRMRKDIPVKFEKTDEILENAKTVAGMINIPLMNNGKE